jgi:tRNA A37 threonylcarbamoyladenosine biosynthesis protein TsaE
MITPALSQNQQDALSALLQLLETEPVVALRRLAGTGKTAFIPHIADAVEKPLTQKDALPS